MASSSSLTGIGAVAPVVDKLVTALARVYRTKCCIDAISRPRNLPVMSVTCTNCWAICSTTPVIRWRPGRYAAGWRERLIQVDDDGPGIAETDHGGAAAVRARHARVGQGIGLAVVTEIIDQYGGKYVRQAALSVPACRLCSEPGLGCGQCPLD